VVELQPDDSPGGGGGEVGAHGVHDGEPAIEGDDEGLHERNEIPHKKPEIQGNRE
jgi:hypothetical protein